MILGYTDIPNSLPAKCFTNLNILVSFCIFFGVETVVVLLLIPKRAVFSKRNILQLLWEWTFDLQSLNGLFTQHLEKMMIKSFWMFILYTFNFVTANYQNKFNCKTLNLGLSQSYNTIKCLMNMKKDITPPF